MKYPETLQLASAAQSTPGLFKEFGLEGVAAPCDSTVQTGEKYREISIEFKSNNYGHKSTISFLTDIKVKEQTSNCRSLVCSPPTVAEKSITLFWNVAFYIFSLPCSHGTSMFQVQCQKICASQSHKVIQTHPHQP